MKSEVDIGAHFVKQSERYQQVVDGANKELYENIRAELDRNLNGVILDIGNGGVFGYDVDKLERVIAVDLAFDENMQDSEKIKYIRDDARVLKTIESNSCDCVVMQFLVHHIVDENIKLTNDSILASLKEAHRVLKPKGKLIIIEEIVLFFIEYVEDVLYKMNFRLLILINKPMIKFYSEKGLRSRLRSAGFALVTIKKIDQGKWVDPFGGLFPGVVKIPAFLYPAKCCAIIAVK